MGRVVAHIDWLREQFNACVLVVHHDNRSGTNMRGSSALDGALDTSIAVVRKGKLVKASIDMAKHHRDEASWTLAPTTVERSIVLVGQGRSDRLNDPAREALEALASADSSGRIATGVWERACVGVSTRNFARIKSDLVSRSLVVTKRVGREDLCELTRAGRDTLDRERGPGR